MQFVYSALLTLAETRLKVGTGKDAINIPKVAANQSTLENLLNVVYAWGAIIAVLVIVLAGLFYTISRGDTQQITRARNAIIAASIGLAIILSAFVITQFVLGRIGG